MSLSRRSLLGSFAAMALAGGTTGCTGVLNLGGGPGATGSVTAPSERPAGDEDALPAFVRENAGFGLDILSTIDRDGSDENLLVSPLSISVALAIAWEGARGETAEQIRDALRYPDDPDTLHPAVGSLQYDLNEVATGDVDGELELTVANSLWGQEEYPFREDYLETVMAFYGDTFEEVDFSEDPDGSRERINGWVADTTNDRIDELLPEDAISSLTRLVITNAVYLLADWEHQFDPDATGERRFTGIDGGRRQVPMMRQTADFRYVSDREAGIQAVELPYVGEDLGMVVLLPAEDTFEAFETELTAERLLDRLAELDEAGEREVEVHLPRFEFGTEAPLRSILEDLGMTDAFDPGLADFDGIAPADEIGEALYVHEVFHETFVSVDEEGTEAAAATGVVMGDDDDTGPPSIVVDRPFYFAIRHRASNAVLFLGRVVDPSAME